MNEKPVVIVDKFDGSLIERFDSTTHLAEHIGKAQNEMSRILRKDKICSGRTQCFYESEYKGFIDFTASKYNAPYLFENMESGEIVWYPNARSAYENEYIDKSYFYKVMRNYNGLASQMGIKFKRIKNTLEIKELLEDGVTIKIDIER